MGLRALLLVSISLGLMALDQNSTRLKPLRESVTWLLSPLVWTAAVPPSVAEKIGSVKTRGQLETENVRYEKEQLILQAQLSKMASLEAENQRIRQLLASTINIKDRVQIAEIIAVNQDPYRHQITLNKGTSDGVYRGQALVDATGIMGQIVEVGPNTSQALLITDPDHGIPVEINRTGLQTIALGRGDGRGLKLPFLPSNADVRSGDLLVSSALGGRFPVGYPVGQIYEVKHTAGEHFMEAVAAPSAKLHQGRQALLVWSEHINVEPASGVAAETAAEIASSIAAATPAGTPTTADAASHVITTTPPTTEMTSSVVTTAPAKPATLAKPSAPTADAPATAPATTP